MDDQRDTHENVRRDLNDAEANVVDRDPDVHISEEPEHKNRDMHLT